MLLHVCMKNWLYDVLENIYILPCLEVGMTLNLLRIAALPCKHYIIAVFRTDACTYVYTHAWWATCLLTPKSALFSMLIFQHWKYFPGPSFIRQTFIQVSCLSVLFLISYIMHNSRSHFWVYPPVCIRCSWKFCWNMPSRTCLLYADSLTCL